MSPAFWPNSYTGTLHKDYGKLPTSTYVLHLRYGEITLHTSSLRHSNGKQEDRHDGFKTLVSILESQPNIERTTYIYCALANNNANNFKTFMPKSSMAKK